MWHQDPRKVDSTLLHHTLPSLASWIFRFFGFHLLRPVVQGLVSYHQCEYLVIERTSKGHPNPLGRLSPVPIAHHEVMSIDVDHFAHRTITRRSAPIHSARPKMTLEACSTEQFYRPPTNRRREPQFPIENCEFDHSHAGSRATLSKMQRPSVA